MLTFKGRHIFLVTGPTDLRKSFNGLAGIARERLGATPASRDLYLFCNRGRNRLKALIYDESGTWVLAKRLDKGTFSWPSTDTKRATIEYGEEQLALLLGGFDAPTLKSRPWQRRAERVAPMSSSRTQARSYTAQA
jgi:transposase